MDALIAHKRFLILAVLLPGIQVFAQIDPAGEWSPRYHEDYPERRPGPEIGDYLGLPITDAARLRGEAWDASLLTVPEHQCKPHPSDYSPRGPAELRITKLIDRDTQQIVAYQTHISMMGTERTIWMDGRPHPPAWAPHTWQGFSTGKWEGDMLTITTTHLKIGWIRRNGIPRSDRATVTEHWIRHENYFTWMIVVTDPVYLTEPFVRTTDFVLDPDQQIAPYPCESVVEVERPRGAVPHHLPGTNPFLNEFADKHGLPREAARGGAETMYPEYIHTINGEPVASAARSLPHPALGPTSPPNGDVRVLDVEGSVRMIVGAGANIAVQTGRNGMLLVDTGLTAYADKVFAAIKDGAPLRYILNTSVLPDHTGGNEALAKKGSTIAGGTVVADIGGSAQEGAAVVAHEQMLARMSALPGIAFGALPTDTYANNQKDLYFNGEAVQLLHVPAAVTDGDSLVFFRRSDVLVTGDAFTPDHYPLIDLERGGNVQGVIETLNTILDIAVPADKQEGGTMIIPGHGRLCDEADVLEYRDMVTIIRDRVQDMIKKGMTLEQVKAARPSQDYDPLYGSSGSFIEAVYKSIAVDPFVGTWKMNPEKSVYKEGNPPKEQIATITVQGGDMTVNVAAVTAEGKNTLVSYSIPADGGMGRMSETSPAYDGISGKHIGPYEREISRWKDGKVVFTARSVIAPDGKSMKTTSKGISPVGKPVDASLVYDKIK
jgi:glyoxylase-like metal-dependent hydrolase (beta-lactamase superfamily II)